MKLVRFGEKGTERPGLIDADGGLRDLGAHIDDVDGHALAPDMLDRLRGIDLADLPLVSGQPRLGACVGAVGKIVCIGLNYHEHAKETGNPVPEHPIVFMKATSAINGPFDDVVIPRESQHTDWEIELGVVIGRTAKYVSPEDALDYVAGYCVVNDVSERFYQTKLTGQWTKGKSCDSFAPLGPWLVTADEIADPQNLDMSLDVNGQNMQSGNTSDMIFPVREIIAHLSSLMSLHPGDIIATGTPPGVGSGKKPKAIFLKAGDAMTGKIAGLGTQQQKLVADTA
ncbi:fumarylacetoacetate hydrolase family protein [Alphaproteobacteria bacterium]|jgi:2-keto-4-pentenoate hydratase/2-oxohepta-3-ene-1,7-dioic acid hydratase in catechol pathway|nr:fumarylacetoacetate hydrolase family protein [Alphaproteobacteria bacterium]